MKTLLIVMRFILVAGIILLAVRHASAQGTWTQKADFEGIGRQSAIGFSIGGKGYMGAGLGGGSYLNDFWEYDPATDSWTQKADFAGSGREALTSFSIGSKGYAGTGTNGGIWFNDFWEYDPVANTWTQKADLPGGGRYNCIGFDIIDKGYIGMGFDGAYQNDWYEFDPSTNIWEQKASLPTSGREAPFGFSIGNKGYVGGGSGLSDFWEYNQSVDEWIQKADFGGGTRSIAASLAITGNGYVGLGSNTQIDFWKYDPTVNTWTQKENYPGDSRFHVATFTINDKGYVGTGQFDAGVAVKDFWEYTPETPPAPPAGNAIQLNGVNDYVDFGNKSEFDFSSSFTVETWMKATSASQTDFIAIVTKGDASWRLQKIPSGSGFNLIFSTSGLTNVDLIGNVQITDTNWHHVAAVYDGVNKYIYVDGILDVSVAVTGTLLITSDPLYVGANTYTGRYYSGEIDEVRIWNVARTGSEIQSALSTTLSGNESGLVAYYKMDEAGQGAGITVVNSATATGSALNGITVGSVGTPVFTSSGTPPENALSFAAANSNQVAIPDAPLLNPTTELTIEAWVNLPDPTLNQKIVAKTYFNGYLLGVANGQIYPQVWNDNAYSFTAGSIIANQWTHLAFTFKAGGNMIAYINGLLVNSIQVTNAPIVNNSFDLLIGNSAYGYNTDGIIDEVAVWNVERTQAQIQTDMLGYISPQSSLVAYYDFNEGVAGGDNSSVTTLLDRSGNANNGTLTNFSLTGATSNWVAGYQPSTGPTPTVDSFTPISGYVGSTVVITGSNFSITPANNIVRFNNAVATVTASTATSITTKVPIGASTGPVRVTVSGSIGTSATNFTVSPPTVITADSLALAAFYTATYNKSIDKILGPWINNTNWLTGPVNTWYGITVSGNRVTEINLSSNNLTGIMSDISPLTGLTKLNLQQNKIGTGFANFYNILPTNIGNLTNLTEIRLASNGGAGTIPTSIGSLTNLTLLDISNNIISGTVPTELGSITNLATLNMSNNLLSGPLPGSLSSLTNLTTMDISKNRFTSLPNLSSISGLTTFNVQSNYFAFGDLEANITKLDTYVPQLTVLPPGGGLVVNPGDPISFSLTTTGSANLYQWYKDGVLIGGATSSSYAIPSAAINDTGNYTVSVSNSIVTGVSLTSYAYSVTVSGTPFPIINSISPSNGPVGTNVTIVGSNFSTTPANNIVYFGGTKANVVTASGTQLRVTVPVGATFKPVTVSVAGRTAYSRLPFVVTFPGNTAITTNSFAPKVDLSFNAGAGMITSEVGDLDGDGKLDIVITNYENFSFSILRNISTTGTLNAGSFASRVDFTTSFTYPVDVTIADVDVDGKLDLLLFGSGRIYIYRNISSVGSITTGSFASPVEFIANGTGAQGLSSVAVGDIDGDGKPDLASVTTLYDKAVSLLRNTSTPGIINSGSFASPVDFLTPHSSRFVSISDMDGDGKADLVVTPESLQDGYGREVSVFKNVGSPGQITTASFAPKVDYPTRGDYSRAGSVADFDSDGKLDIAVFDPSDLTNFSNNSVVSFFRNNSSPGTLDLSSFDSRFDIGFDHRLGQGYLIGVSDFNGDSKLDFAIVDRSFSAAPSSLNIFKNTSTPGKLDGSSFANKVSFATGNDGASITIGDLDGDGKPDLIIPNKLDNNISIYRNTNTIRSSTTLADSLALVSLYNSTNGSTWTNKTNWLTGKVNTWYGVTVTNSRVSGLNLNSNNLTGTLPAQMGNLTALTALTISNNNLTGSVPAEAMNMTALSQFNLQNNNLNALPDLSGIYTLQTLNIANNLFTFEDIEPNVAISTFTYSPQKLIPGGNLVTLQVGSPLNLSLTVGGTANHYQWLKNSSPIAGANVNPLVIANITAIDQGSYQLLITNTIAPALTLNSTPFTVSITVSSADSLTLVKLYTSSNGVRWFNKTNWLEGPISTWHGVTVINAEITGLNLSGNNLVNNIPDEFSTLDKLISVDLSGNRIKFIPDLSTLPSLTSFNVSGNRLEFGSLEPNGSIPGFIYSPQDSVETNEIIIKQLSSSLTLTSLVHGTSTSYQWKKDSNDISGAISASLILPNVSFADEGAYQYAATNSALPALTLFSRIKTLNVSSLQRDSIALKTLYDSTGGDFWVDHSNWINTPLETGNWQGVTIADYKVTGLNLPGNNLTGKLPLQFAMLTELVTVDLSGNQITSIPDLSSNTHLTSLKLFNNRLEFGSLEANASIAGISYVPQDSVSDYESILVQIGENKTFDSKISGTTNNYQWNKNGAALTGATSPGLAIDNISFEDDAIYGFQVTNTLVPGLTLYSKDKILRVSSLERDSIALRTLYTTTDGDHWTNKTNWLTTPLGTGNWFGITISNRRVTQVNLPNNNLVGRITAIVSDIENLESLNLSGNHITSLPDLRLYPSISILNVSNNNLDFSSLEQNASIRGINYQNQALLGMPLDTLVEVNKPMLFKVVTKGNSNNYQWKRNGNSVAEATVAAYELTSIGRDNMGTYECEVTNAVVPGLTLKTAPQRAIAVAKLSGRLYAAPDRAAASGRMTLFKITNEGKYDTTAVQAIKSDGTYLFEKIVVDDYALMGFADTLAYPDALPTYFENTIYWEEAERIKVNSNLDTLDVVSTYEPTNVPKGVGMISGYFEEPEVAGGRDEGAKRVSGAGASVRSVATTARPLDEVLTLVAYVFTNDQGEFEMPQLPKGDYRLNIQYPGYPMDPTSFITITIGDGLESQVRVAASVEDNKIKVTKHVITGVWEKAGINVQVYPNPSADHVIVGFQDASATRSLELLNMLSAKMTSQAATQKENNLNVSQYPAGVYLLRVKERGEVVKIVRIVVE